MLATAQGKDKEHLKYEDIKPLLAFRFLLGHDMTHSEKSHIGQMRAWPYRQERRGHGPTKKNLSYR